MQSPTVIIIDNSNRFPAIDTESSISLIFTYINIISCSYVLSRLYFVRQSNGVENKYQFYFAITYLMYSILQIINVFIRNYSLFQISQISHDELFFGIFGTFYPTFLTVNLLLIGFLEFSTLSKINKRIDIETGKYDIYMWKGLFFLSWIISIFGINRYEPLELNPSRPDSGFGYHLNAIIIFIVVVNTISYFVELRKILHKVISREFLNTRLETYDYMNPNVIRSYLFCIIPFLFQWSLILIYNIIKSIGINESSLNILLIIAVNIGGIGHGISYFIYERKYLTTNFSNIYPIILSYGALLPTDDQLITISTS